MQAYKFMMNVQSSFTPPCSDETHWSSVPEPRAAETQEATHVVLSSSDHRVGETIPPTEVPRFGREIGSCHVAQDDGRSGEDMVSEPPHQMEVRWSSAGAQEGGASFGSLVHICFVGKLVEKILLK